MTNYDRYKMTRKVRINTILLKILNKVLKEEKKKAKKNSLKFIKTRIKQ